MRRVRDLSRQDPQSYSRFMIKPREGSNPPGPTSENDHHWEDFNTWLLGRHRHCFSCWIKGDAGALTPERVVERIFRAVCSVDQSRLSLCDPVDCSPPGSSVHGISQGRTLEWAAIPSSRGPSRPGIKPGSLMPPALHACMLSRFSLVRLCATPQTAAHQAPLSPGFSRQEYSSGLPFPSPHPIWERGQTVPSCSAGDSVPPSRLESLTVVGRRRTGKYFSVLTANTAVLMCFC